MKGAAKQAIQQLGREYTVRNATGGSGRQAPSYSDDGSLVGVLERRGRPTTTTVSAGEDVETDLEIRAIVGSDTTIRTAGTTDEYPTELVHPDGPEYRVVDEYPEDSGVTVLSVVRE